MRGSARKEYTFPGGFAIMGIYLKCMNLEKSTGKEVRMKALTGKLMAGDRIAALVESGEITECDERLLPLFLCRTKNLEQWLAGRAIDSHRPNSRILKKMLRLKPAEDAEVAMEVNGATITDHYWFCPEGSSKAYKDIQFMYNYFDSAALRGDPDGFSREPSRTPELTNTGSYEKCWRLVDGKWWLYKAGTKQEYFSELFICRLGMSLGFSMAWYEMEDGYIRTRDFTEGKYNFEAMDGITGEEDDYNCCFTALYEISPEIAGEYLKILWLDTLCYNMDRHTKNFGVLRDRENGEILSMAPNYDNNIALISRGYVKDITRETDGLIRFFRDFVTENKVAAKMYKEMLEAGEIPIAGAERVGKAVDETEAALGQSFDEERKYLKEFIMNGQRILQNIVMDTRVFQ